MQQIGLPFLNDSKISGTKKHFKSTPIDDTCQFQLIYWDFVICFKIYIKSLFVKMIIELS